MRKTHKIAAIVIALVASQLLSGCYVLRELDWSKDKLSKGDTSKARVGLQGTGDDQDSYFFLMIAGEGNELEYTGAKFDKKKALGNKAQKMVRDDDLFSIAASSEICNSFFPVRRGTASSSGLYRTKKEVKESSKFVDAEATMKASNNNVAGSVVAMVLSGYWFDDGDGVPEDNGDDEIDCSGASTTTLQKKGNQVRAASVFESLSE